eukprot:scaffold16378_cov112-Isochrysis_galbana.AAC.3
MPCKSDSGTAVRALSRLARASLADSKTRRGGDLNMTSFGVRRPQARAARRAAASVSPHRSSFNDSVTTSSASALVRERVWPLGGEAGTLDGVDGRSMCGLDMQPCIREREPGAKANTTDLRRGSCGGKSEIKRSSQFGQCPASAGNLEIDPRLKIAWAPVLLFFCSLFFFLLLNSYGFAISLTKKAPHRVVMNR